MSTDPPPDATGVQSALRRAAAWIREAQALLVAAGAGMGVDSGLPDFRGTEGFWRAYPVFRDAGLRFEALANDGLFESDPTLAWGFYGHRLQLYRSTVPHAGFALLRSWMTRCPLGGFVYTSNVDGQFQRAGFDEQSMVECHGSIHFVQHADDPDGPIWSADSIDVQVDPRSMRAAPPLPARAGRLLRPNILMFGDGGWNPRRAEAQLQRYRHWLGRAAKARLVVVEIGAGTAVPTVRLQSAQLVRLTGAKLIRINPREPQVSGGAISLPLPALVALRALEQALAAA